MPSSRHVASSSSSGSRLQSEYSVWSAAIGWTVARATQRRGRGLRQSQIAHLAGRDQVGHRADGVLDRRRRVDAVLIVEVDGVDAEPLQRSVAGLAHVLRPAVDAERLAVGVAHEPELRGHDDLRAPVADRLADEAFVGVRPVDVGGVEQGHTEVDRAMDGGDGSGTIGGAIELRHAHAAEAEGGDGKAGRAEATLRNRCGHPGTIPHGRTPARVRTCGETSARILHSVRAGRVSYPAVTRRGRARSDAPALLIPPAGSRPDRRPLRGASGGHWPAPRSRQGRAASPRT